MIRIEFSPFAITGAPEDLARLGRPLTDQEMADMAAVSPRTVSRWKAHPRFPRSDSGRVTCLEFLRFLLRGNTA